jgi:hypothetical protein
VVTITQMGEVADPPPLLITWKLCKRYNSLPYAGGILQQPAKIMDAFLIIDNLIIDIKSQRGQGYG